MPISSKATLICCPDFVLAVVLYAVIAIISQVLLHVTELSV